MNADDARRLYAYTDWANDRILAVSAELSNEQLTRNIESSFSSIRGTLAHIAFAEWLWLADLTESFRAIASDRRMYLAGLPDDGPDSLLHYRSTKGDPFSMPLRDLLVHCANHSTYHRGQVVTMLRQVGATPPNTDYTQFARS